MAEISLGKGAGQRPSPRIRMLRCLLMPSLCDDTQL
jgi:hypothetical protein